MILFILTILYLLGEIYTMSILIKPISDIIEIWKQLLEKDKNRSANIKVISALFVTILFTAYYYLSSKYINNIYFSIASIILAISCIIGMLPALIYCNDTDHLIEIRCNKRNIIINRIKEFFIVIYILIVLVKIFI